MFVTQTNNFNKNREILFTSYCFYFEDCKILINDKFRKKNIDN